MIVRLHRLLVRVWGELGQTVWLGMRHSEGNSIKDINLRACAVDRAYVISSDDRSEKSLKTCLASIGLRDFSSQAPRNDMKRVTSKSITERSPSNESFNYQNNFSFKCWQHAGSFNGCLR